MHGFGIITYTLTSKQISQASHGVVLRYHELDALGIQISLDRHKKRAETANLRQPPNAPPELCPPDGDLTEPLNHPHPPSRENHFFRHPQTALSQNPDGGP